ncbi:hypothetical protein, partial [Glutamicibacter arilaitensis]|uniref:hypothetical protein n=2 Tax=Micrococcaceae TaxID=1268 RepID=UPI003F8FC71C
MTVSQIQDAIEAGQPTEVASLALCLDPEAIYENFDFHRISDDAQPYWDFAKLWVQSAPALAKPLIARWVLDIATSEFAYLEIESEADKLLISSVQDAKNCLASLIEDVSVLSDNPDAGLAKAQILELGSASKTLKDRQSPNAGIWYQWIRQSAPAAGMEVTFCLRQHGFNPSLSAFI